MDEQLKNIIQKVASSTPQNSVTYLCQNIIDTNDNDVSVHEFVKWIVEQYYLGSEIVTQRLFNIIGMENVLYVVKYGEKLKL